MNFKLWNCLSWPILKKPQYHHPAIMIYSKFSRSNKQLNKLLYKLRRLHQQFRKWLTFWSKGTFMTRLSIYLTSSKVHRKRRMCFGLRLSCSNMTKITLMVLRKYFMTKWDLQMSFWIGHSTSLKRRINSSFSLLVALTTYQSTRTCQVQVLRLSKW